MFYKRDMLIKMFSIDVTSSANQFQEQLEQTADIVVKRLEEQIVHLEELLEEANQKIAQLDEKIQIVNEMIDKKNVKDNEIVDTTHLVMPNTTQIENEDSNSTLRLDDNVGEVENQKLSCDDYKNSIRSDWRNSIVEMADSGYDITEIAKRTGISKGEIMLLLQLNKK